MSRIRLAWCGLLATALVAGCAGSPATQGPSASARDRAFLARVDGVCARAVAAHAGHPFPVAGFDPERPDPRQLPAVGDYFATYGGLSETVGALHRLAPPADQTARWAQVLGLADRMVANARRQIAAARAEDVRTFVVTVHTAQALIGRLDSAGAALGLSEGSPCREVFG